jgi:hypothetical protein
MNYLHSEVNVDPGQAVVVQLDHAANVKVMDDFNFGQYQRGQSHRYHGGYVRRSPYAIRPPSSGRWHVTVDLGGYTGSVRAAITVQ